MDNEEIQKIARHAQSQVICYVCCEQCGDDIVSVEDGCTDDLMAADQAYARGAGCVEGIDGVLCEGCYDELEDGEE